jgi:hypothetical protein
MVKKPQRENDCSFLTVLKQRMYGILPPQSDGEVQELFYDLPRLINFHACGYEMEIKCECVIELLC